MNVRRSLPSVHPEKVRCWGISRAIGHSHRISSGADPRAPFDRRPLLRMENPGNLSGIRILGPPVHRGNRGGVPPIPSGLRTFFCPCAHGQWAVGCLCLVALKGMKTFFGRAPMRRRYWIVFALVEVGLACFLYVSPDLNIRVLLVSLFMGTICLLIARELIFSAPAHVRFSSRLTAAVIGVFGGTMIMRGFVTPLWAPSRVLSQSASRQPW